MAKSGQTGQTGGTRRYVALFSLGLALLTGCSTMPTGTHQAIDPLHGHRSPPSGMPVPDSHRTPGTPTSFPRSSTQGQQNWDLSSTNNATLAGLSGQGPLGRPLAIDDQGRALAPGQLTTGAKTQQTPTSLGYSSPGPNANPKVEAIPDAGANPARYTPNSWQADAPAAATGNEALKRQLQERGVINQKVDQLSQGVHLTCYVSRGPGGSPRILEVTAVDYATAAQAILHQLDAR